MKFTWFNLMPWPYLPDDFRAKHRSVWVPIDRLEPASETFVPPHRHRTSSPRAPPV